MRAKAPAPKRATRKKPRPAPMYLIARGPKAYQIGSVGHEDESLDWQLTIAPLGLPPTKVPGHPAHVRREVCQMLGFGSASYREAHSKGEPLTPFPPTPPHPTAAQRAAAHKATAMRRARERSYEPGRLGMGAGAGYLEALRKLVGDDGGYDGVGHKGVSRLLRDAFLAEIFFREHRQRAGSLEEWVRWAARERLNFYASLSFQDEALAFSHSQEMLRGQSSRARTPDEARVIAEKIRAEMFSARALGTAALGNPPPGRKPGSRTRKGRQTFAPPKSPRLR